MPAINRSAYIDDAAQRINTMNNILVIFEITCIINLFGVQWNKLLGVFKNWGKFHNIKK